MEMLQDNKYFICIYMSYDNPKAWNSRINSMNKALNNADIIDILYDP